MKTAPIQPNEDNRMKAVNKLGLLEDSIKGRFDAFTKEAIERLHMPISTISVLDKEKEHYQSCKGLDAEDGDRAISFCGHALLAHDIFIVEDTLEDDRFSDNPAVIGPPYIRFYAGIALFDNLSGFPVAVFCVKDTKPRVLTLDELGIFTDIGNRLEKDINNIMTG